MTMRNLAKIILGEAKPKKDKRKEDSPKPKSKGKKPGRKPRKKVDVAALEAFVAQIQRLKELIEAKREYERLKRQLSKGQHGQSRVMELMREYFAEAFKDVGEAYDEALDPVLRLETIAVRMISKQRAQPQKQRMMEILLEDASPVVQEAIARAEKLASENPGSQFWEEWELLDVAESYGYRKDKRVLAEGVGDWLKSKGKQLLSSIRKAASWFKSKGTPELSSIATELESLRDDPSFQADMEGLESWESGGPPPKSWRAPGQP